MTTLRSAILHWNKERKERKKSCCPSACLLIVRSVWQLCEKNDLYCINWSLKLTYNLPTYLCDSSDGSDSITVVTVLTKVSLVTVVTVMTVVTVSTQNYFLLQFLLSHICFATKLLFKTFFVIQKKTCKNKLYHYFFLLLFFIIIYSFYDLALIYFFCWTKLLSLNISCDRTFLVTIFVATFFCNVYNRKDQAPILPFGKAKMHQQVPKKVPLLQCNSMVWKQPTIVQQWPLVFDENILNSYKSQA